MGNYELMQLGQGLMEVEQGRYETAQLHFLRKPGAELFPATFFSDPVWDILLELNRAHRLRIPMTLADLVTTTHIKRNVVKRCLELLASEEFVYLNQNDQSDSQEEEFNKMS